MVKNACMLAAATLFRSRIKSLYLSNKTNHQPMLAYICSV